MKLKNWRRWIAGVVGALSIVNGLLMLLDPEAWYSTTPGVTETGPFNPHFVLDVGFAFTAAGVGLAMFAWKERYWAAGLIGTLFIGLHGVLHASMIVRGTTSTVAIELFLVVLPAIAAVIAIWPKRSN